LVLVLVLQNGLGYIAARLSFCRSVSQDHFLVCFTISAYKCDNGCYCLFAYRDVSTVLLGARRLHCGICAIMRSRSVWCGSWSCNNGLGYCYITARCLCDDYADSRVQFPSSNVDLQLLDSTRVQFIAAQSSLTLSNHLAMW